MAVPFPAGVPAVFEMAGGLDEAVFLGELVALFIGLVAASLCRSNPLSSALVFPAPADLGGGTTDDL
jgi:hypothetical protein